MADLQSKPTLRSAYGQEFCPLDDTWTIHDFGNIRRLHFEKLSESSTERFRASVKGVFAVLAQTRNANTCEAALTRVRTTAKAWKAYSGEPLDAISSEALTVALRAGIPLALWRMILRTWVLQDQSKPVADALAFAERTLGGGRKKTGKRPGETVLTWDPEDGPYRPEEDEVIRVALDHGFNQGKITRKDYTVMRMFRGLGMRPVQLAAMKVCDFRDKNGSFALRVPMAKQRSYAERDLFMPWKSITQGLGHLLKLHVLEYVQPRLASGVSLEDAPLFPKARGKILGSALSHHVRPDVLRKVYSRLFKVLEIRSPITGELMVGNARRDRHTLLTMLAMKGCTKEQIAANAGHSNPDSCAVYLEVSTDHFQRMESIVGASFVPVADRFMGRIEDPNDESSSQDPEAQLHDEASRVGSCAVGGCNAIEAGAAPLACYTCPKFRAWEDAPHAVLMDRLERERNQLISQGHHEVAQTRTSTIVAIADLLQAIHEKKSAGQHG